VGAARRRLSRGGAPCDALRRAACDRGRIAIAGVVFAPPVVFRERTFFGSLSVQPWENETIALLHGTTIHGFQNVVLDKRDIPLSYHHPDGPIGELYESLEGDPRLDDVGVLGLGVGTMAAYGEAGQDYTFYEIDQAVVDIATDERYFTYLADTPADLHIVLGDARLTLADATQTRHGLLFMNAFTSDAIPVHLLTREAVQLYFDRLEPDGLLVFNVSNRYLDVQSVVAAIAQDQGLAVLARDDDEGDVSVGRYTSQWVVVARDAAAFGTLDDGDSEWFVPQPAPGTPVWTDAFSNLLGIYYWD
jgi:SAM-dependent methyltransferase